MNCREFRELLADLLYEELDSDARERAMKHVDACETCRKQFDTLRRTMAALDRWPAVESPLDPSIVAVLAGGRRPRRSALRPVLAGAIAAGIAFVALTLIGAEATYNRERGLRLAYGRTGESPGDSPAENGGKREFMLLLFEPPGHLADADPQQTRAVVNEYLAWAGEISEQGHFVAGEKLTESLGRTLRSVGGDVHVTDGADEHPAEVLAGFFHITADSYDRAVEIARTCPHVKYGTRIDVREIEGT